MTHPTTQTERCAALRRGGWSLRLIGERLGLSLSSVASYLRRARAYGLDVEPRLPVRPVDSKRPVRPVPRVPTVARPVRTDALSPRLLALALADGWVATMSGVLLPPRHLCAPAGRETGVRVGVRSEQAATMPQGVAPLMPPHDRP